MSQSATEQKSQQEQKDRASLSKLVSGGKFVSEGAAELYRHYRRPFLQFFQRNSMDPGQAEDLLQEVFISIVRHAGDFRGQSSVSSWLWTIARHKLIDHARAQKPETTLDEDGWAVVENNLVHEEAGKPHQLDDCVNRAFGQFAKSAPDRAEALRRISLDGWSVEQVAQFLDRTPGATREYLSQCRKKFKQFLEPCRELMSA